ncbi:MAG TPA: hypothetical protein VHF91_12410, partial [Acidimicrobiales bacterium]|nr:hypothetical protein [Acidimicrobiales bacterium]
LGRRTAVGVAVIGGLLTPLAGYGLANAAGTDRAAPGDSLPAGASRRPEALPVTVQRTIYEPGQSSGWHSHAGVHTVIVISGSLTVYDPSCRPRSFGPQDPYIGGLENHLARNESDAPVEMMVVYTRAGGVGVDVDTRAEQPPDRCPV